MRPLWFVLIPELLLLGSSIDTQWYTSLQKPSFQPPGAAFGLAWGILYPLLGYAYYLLLQQGDERQTLLFEVQLILNLAWSYVFFTLHNVRLSAVMLVLMIILNLVLYQSFPKPWYLLYIVWLAFALTLTLAILRLNPSSQ
jgi:tryptophan-rich sensory protein